MSPLNLIPRPDLETVDLEEELMVFDPIQEASHILNQTAAEIWRLLAERKPGTDLVGLLARQYGLPDGEAIQRSVEETLRRLEGLGLLIPADPVYRQPDKSPGPPAPPFGSPGEAEELFLEADRLLRNGQMDQAAQVLEPLRHPPLESPDAHSNQGVSEILLGRWAEAEEALEQAYGMDPANPGIAFNLSSLRFHQGRPEEALELLTRVEAGDPDNVHLLSLAGRILTALDRLDDAREKLSRAVTIEPGFINIHSELAQVYLLQNRLDEAEERLQAGLRLSSSYPDLYRSLGHLQFKRGDLEGALSSYQRCLALAPRDWLTRYNLSVVHFHCRSYPEAIREAERCLENNPDYLPAYELLARTCQAQGDRPQSFLVYLRARSYAAHFSEEDFPLLHSLAWEAARRGGDEA
ncbi:MAG: PqqD family peptide modification chaperone [Desulfobacteraceae bacterium]|nr:MAG: PqqD family peptide modification chaperone [Desulfobacteraceae bacterium]